MGSRGQQAMTGRGDDVVLVDAVHIFLLQKDICPGKVTEVDFVERLVHGIRQQQLLDRRSGRIRRGPRRAAECHRHQGCEQQTMWMFEKTRHEMILEMPDLMPRVKVL